jgi:hypothetical protein
MCDEWRKCRNRKGCGRARGSVRVKWTLVALLLEDHRNHLLNDSGSFLAPISQVAIPWKPAASKRGSVSPWCMDPTPHQFGAVGFIHPCLSLRPEKAKRLK